jgi:ERCC4-type nuclease
LLEQFGSIAAIAAASQEELKRVRGIGDRRARTLRQLLAGDAPSR